MGRLRPRGSCCEGNRGLGVQQQLGRHGSLLGQPESEEQKAEEQYVQKVEQVGGEKELVGGGPHRGGGEEGGVLRRGAEGLWLLHLLACLRLHQDLRLAEIGSLALPENIQPSANAINLRHY